MDSTSTIYLVVARVQRDETIDDPIALFSTKEKALEFANSPLARDSEFVGEDVSIVVLACEVDAEKPWMSMRLAKMFLGDSRY
jgi:hypothetical protein